MFLDRKGVDWKEGDCQVICGRVRSEGFLCRDKLKYRVLSRVSNRNFLHENRAKITQRLAYVSSNNCT